MEAKTKIAFVITILMGLAAVTICFLTYQAYLSINVFQGEKIVTQDGTIYVTIDEYFRDDVSNETVRFISKSIENELFKKGESEVEDLVKDFIHRDFENKMKIKMIDDEDYTNLTIKKEIGYLHTINNCGGCFTGAISTRPCCTARTEGAAGGLLDFLPWTSEGRQWSNYWSDQGCQNWDEDQPTIPGEPTKGGTPASIREDWRDIYPGFETVCKGKGLESDRPDSCQASLPSNPPGERTYATPRQFNERHDLWGWMDVDLNFVRGFCKYSNGVGFTYEANPTLEQLSEQKKNSINIPVQSEEDSSYNVKFFNGK